MRGCSGCCWSYPPVYQDKCNIACLTSDGNLRWLNLVDVRQHLPGNVQAIVTGFYTSLGGTIDGITNATCIGDGRLLMLLIDVPSLDLYSLVLDAVTGAIVAAPQDLGIGGDTTAGDAIGFVPGAGGGIVLYRFVDLGGGEKQFRREFIDFTGTLSAHDGPTYTTGSNLQTLVSRHGQVITLLSDAEGWALAVNDGTVNSFRLDLEVSSATHLTASQVTNSVFVLERNEGNAAIRWLQIDIDAETVTPLSAAGDVELPQARGTVRETDEEGFWYAEGDSGAKWVYYNMTLNANNNIQHEILPGVADDGTVSFDSLHPDSTAAFSWNVDGAGTVYLVARFAANKFRPLAVEKDGTVTLYPGILEQEAGFGGGTIPRVVVPARGVFYTHGQWNRHISPHTGIGGGTGEDEFTVGSGLARFEFDEMAGEISNDWEWQIFPSGSQPLGIVPHFDESGDLFVIDRALTLTGTGAGNGRFDDDVYRQLDVRRLCKCNEVDEARIFEVANPLGAWSYTFTNPAHESLIESMLVEADLLYDDEETGCHWMHEGQQSGGGVTATLTWDLAVTHNTTDATLVDYTLTVTLALTGAINDSHSVSYSESSVEPTDSGPFTFDCDTDLAGRTWNIGGGNQIIFPAEFTVSVDDTAVPD